MPRYANVAFTPREERFIAEYLVDGNGTRAAVAAGYSEGNAKSQAYELLKRPHVLAEIKRRQRAIAKKLELSAEKVLTDIARVATKAERAKKYGDALKGHEMLGKHLRLFADKVEHSGPNGGPMEFSEVRRTIVDPKGSAP
jgi:phage terminase small subunit